MHHLKKFHLIFCLTIISVMFPGINSATNQINYVMENYSIPEPLNGLTGDPINGRRLVIDRNKGNCLACHSLPIPEEEFHGTIGPSLLNIANRLNEAQIRLRVTDMKKLNPFSMMPGYLRTSEKMNRIAPQFQDTTILTAQEVEDITSYLATLKTDPSGAVK